MASVKQLLDVRWSCVRTGGSGARKLPFGTLSITGGIVNAYNALKMAEEVSNGEPKP
jgi:hypothetical protein